MPGKVKVKILAGRNLPVMDRSSDTTDAYVEIKLGNTTYKTEVCRKSLNPVWDSEWYRYEVDDSELQDEPLQIRLMDYDTYSANDSIGKVYLDLNPLLLPHPAAAGKCAGGPDGPPSSGSAPGGTIFSGWIPVFDTMHGIRGEVNIIVKVELFSDFNKFRQSSCGVQFFCSPVIPCGYHVLVVHGFVEELVVNDDPEYQWIDKIRTPRASNEARQTLFFKLSGELQRKIGLKALDLGGNAVIGYNQCFDLEGESGIVVRGIGTAVTLTKIQEHILPTSAPLDPPPVEDRQAPTGGGDEPLSSERPPASPPTVVSAVVAAAAATAAKVSPSPAKLCSLPAICRRSSDSDLSITPKGNSLTGSDRSSTAGLQLRAPLATPRTALNQENLDMMEYPFLTMTKYPPGFIVHIGGMVNARSVKLLERISNLEEPESRDSWWTELRMEVRSHARALACNVVLGYEESTSICDDVCVLSAAGTAAVVASGPADPAPPQPPSSAAAAASAAIAAAQAQASTQQATPQQQPAPAASALASAGASPAQAPPSAPAQPQTPAAAAAGVSAAEAVATPGPSSSAVVVAAATVIASNADRFAATAAVAGTASFSSSLDREVPSPQQERERDRSTPQRTPALAAASSTAFVSVSQPLSMTGKVRHCSEGVGGAATEEAGGLGTFAGASTATGATSSHSQTQMQAQCWPCHLPYNENVVPFRVVASRCSVCRRHRVPELMYTSIEPPEGLAITGRGCLLHAYVCRPKRDMGRGELNAKEISDGLPFLEYELHRTLSYKLRLRGMNAVFGLRVQVAIGERLMVAMATGTACYLAALPPAPVPKVTAGNLLTEDSALVEVQRMIQDAVRRARESFGLPVAPRTAATAATGSATAASSTTSTAAAAASSTTTTAAATAASDTDESEEDLPDLELSSGNKDACVFEIDDTEDMEVVKHLLEPPPPDGFQACTTELPPGLDESELAPGPQMFTHVWRSRLPVAQGPASRTLHALCTRLLQGLFFKLRRAAPAALTRLRFRVELPDADEIQISVLGMALGVVEVERPPPRGRRKLIAQSCSRELLSTRRDESDLIFSLEEDQVAEAAPSGGTPPPSAPAASPAAPTTAPMPAVRPLARTFQSLRISSHGGAGAASAAAAALSRERFGVDISPLSYAPGGRIERYLGNLNFFFIRESTSIREAGGLSGFVHSFACEVLAIVRSHVTALGGNAMVAYFMSECVLYHNPHKNQGQCLINVGGDVVSVSYDE